MSVYLPNYQLIRIKAAGLLTEQDELRRFEP